MNPVWRPTLKFYISLERRSPQHAETMTCLTLTWHISCKAWGPANYNLHHIRSDLSPWVFVPFPPCLLWRWCFNTDALRLHLRENWFLWKGPNICVYTKPVFLLKPQTETNLFWKHGRRRPRLTTTNSVVWHWQVVATRDQLSSGLSVAWIS